MTAAMTTVLAFATAMALRHDDGYDEVAGVQCVPAKVMAYDDDGDVNL